MTWLGLLKKKCLDLKKKKKRSTHTPFPICDQVTTLTGPKEVHGTGITIPVIASVCQQITCQRWHNPGIFIQVNEYVTLLKILELSHCLFTKVYDPEKLLDPNLLLVSHPHSTFYLKVYKYIAKLKELYTEYPYINHNLSLTFYYTCFLTFIHPINHLIFFTDFRVNCGYQ